MTVKNKVFNYLIIGCGLLGILFLLPQCQSNPFPLKEGIWRATLDRKDGQQVVFNFEVQDSLNQPVIYVFNANDRMRVDSITFYGEDSVYIHMPFFGSHFNAKINKKGNLQGVWTKNYGKSVAQMPFKAVAGDSTRLPAYSPATQNVSGSWEVSFERRNGTVSKAIGEFKQEGSRVTGTFLTPTGDYRYLQGVVSGDSLRISGFDGCHALLFTALVEKDQLKEGNIYSINSPAGSWYAKKKDYDSLPAAYAVNTLQPGQVKLNLNLRDMKTGKMVSLEDSTYQNKVVIISILGSWCPNCMDETPFLTNYYNKNRQRGIEVLGIDFERTADYEKSRQALQSFFRHFDINYPILFSGVASSDPKLTEKVFPGLPDPIRAFPTTIFIDKAGFVRKIHKGFNGPATGKYYTEFKKEFNTIVDNLLAEG